uniref:Uncharacterized protein n=1 Tax=Arundo donax TaxID=35708 RepID=A0A0A9C291_ARUDO
MFLPRLEHRK